MTPPPKIMSLIERFENNREAYHSSGYNETQLRQEFLDPFFKALGWDVDNEQGYSEAYKDVIHEDQIKVGGGTKAPDYCFRIGGTRKFFVEAKKPAVNLKEDASPAFQLRRYAWSAKLPLSILTDFEEFAVYDCRVRPDKTDKASAHRVMYFRYDDYLEKWDDIVGIFSREEVLKGSFDKYAESMRRKKGTAEVDAAFLSEIETWRNELARNLALRNKDLSQRELNFAVSRTIDRIIFLRVCEDRGIEPYGQLQELLDKQKIYKQLFQIFHRADERYNSGLFYFKKEKERPGPPDELTPSLKLDDKKLKDIIRSLYYPDSPYEFSVLPADILGQVYEQFLGKVIRLTKGHQAKVEDKPEVKKAGGVYYTPTYIVDYIVKHTVGKLLEDKTPKQAAKLRILDPACGSGSFLIGAYQYLLDWHRDWYVSHLNKGLQPLETSATDKGVGKGLKPLVYQVSGGEWRLTTAERKRILLNNIYGVDIDPQAVEVTKLSLLLKVLEGESRDTIESQLRMFRERALPDLSSNIKCGNTLIGPDFYEHEQMTLLDDEERYRINAFDWQTEFAPIMKAGGFDAVIGNPPYLYSAGQDYLDYFNEHYSLRQYQTDYYVYFIECALKLCRKEGKVSFIVSDSWTNSEYFSVMRNHLLTSHKIDVLAVFGYPVFKAAALENSIFVISNQASPTPIPVEKFSNPNEYKIVNRVNPSDAVERGLIDYRTSSSIRAVISKIENGSIPLDRIVNLNRGIHAYRTDGYGISKFGGGPQTKRDKDEMSYHADSQLDKTYLPELKGRDIQRYSHKKSVRFLSYGPWLAEPRKPDFFFQPKIVLRKILGRKLHGTFLDKQYALDQSLYIAISRLGDNSLLLHILGILLSTLGAWYLRNKFAIYDTLYPWYTKKQLSAFPMKEKDNRLISIVERMLELNRELPKAKTPDEKTRLERQITATDRQIDKLVYELYGLTEDEIKIMEGV